VDEGDSCAFFPILAVILQLLLLPIPIMADSFTQDLTYNWPRHTHTHTHIYIRGLEL